MATLIMLVGIPGVGKSTYVNNLLKTKDFGIVSSDQYIEREAENRGKTYSQVFRDVANTAQKLAFEDVKKFVDIKADIVWDQTNLNSVKRAHRLKMVPNCYTKCAVNFKLGDALDPVILIKLIDRANKRPGKHIDHKIFLDMVCQTEYADYNEGFDFIRDIKVEL